MRSALSASLLGDDARDGLAEQQREHPGESRAVDSEPLAAPAPPGAFDR